MSSDQPDTKRSFVNQAWLCGVLLTAGIVASYWDSFATTVSRWMDDPNYSHGWIVPIVSLCFAWMGYRKHGPLMRRRVASAAQWHGWLFVTVGVGFHLWAWLTRDAFVDIVAVVVFLRGMLWILGGRRGVRAYSAAVTFLLFAAPLPFGWQQWLANELQHFVSVASASSLAVFGVPVLREGYFLHFPNSTLEIAETCSGLRQLSAFLAGGFVIGIFLNRGGWFTFSMVALALPIAVVSNCVRVIITGLVLHSGHAAWAQGMFHSMEGLGVILVGFLIQAALATLIAKCIHKIQTPVVL